MGYHTDFSWRMDPDTTEYLDNLKSRYRMGLPALAPDVDDRYLRPEDLLNDDLDLGGFESPIVLSMMAVKDPFCPAALAAANRLLPRAAQSSARLQVAKVMHSRSRHTVVRKGVLMVARQGFDPDALQRFAAATTRRIDDDRADAQQAMAGYLRRLVVGGEAPPTIMDDLLRLSYRCSLSPTTVRQLILNTVESRKVNVRAKVALLRDIKRLPRQFQLELITRVTSMRKTHATDALRRCLEDVFLGDSDSRITVHDRAGDRGITARRVSAAADTHRAPASEYWMVPRFRALDSGLSADQPPPSERYLARGNDRISLR
jgi:hypothetical protein